MPGSSSDPSWGQAAYQPPADAPAPPPLDPGAPGSAAGGGEPTVEAVAAVRDRALHHRTEQTRTYPCASCGGELEFDIARQKLRCPSCGNEQAIAEHDRTPQEQDLRTVVAAMRSGALDREAQQLTGAKQVFCQNCGGETSFTGSLTSTRCPYCATPIQREDVHEAPTRLAVDGIVPFGIDKHAATTAIEHWINGRWFAPSEFKKYNRTGAFNSVYSAYFTYDAETYSSYAGERGDDYTVTVGSGEDAHTETRTRWSHVSGAVANSFDDIAVCANDGLDRKHVAKLEPWPTQMAKGYSAEYVAGHLCRTYDRDVEACFGEAKSTIDDEVRNTVRRDIGGDHQRISSVDTSYNTLSYKHLLLPIWLLTVIYQEKPFQVMINGITGEVQGQRPYSTVKIAAAIVAAVVAVIIVAVIYAATKS
jgi:DNA-directed RNA polymerase subunit RPC12/RpoP